MKKPSTARRAKNKNSNSSKPVTAGNVRIIGGQFKRRSIAFIDADGLRPTPDRLRETLFNWLLADIHGARVLDSCAGSGVLGFEALSRGAAHCCFIEISKPQSLMLLQSAQQLHVDDSHYRIIHGAAEQLINQHLLQPPFNIVFIDPPYAKDLWQPILSALINNKLITTETLIYLEAAEDLNVQLEQLIQTLQTTFTAQGLKGFICKKQTKIGQVVAGLYQLTAS